MKLSRIYYKRARRKALIGLAAISVAVAASLWALALLPALAVTGFVLMGCALLSFTIGVELMFSALDLWRSAKIERIVENSNLPI
jgi:hypothetical protein